MKETEGKEGRKRNSNKRVNEYDKKGRSMSCSTHVGDIYEVRVGVGNMGSWSP